MDRFDQISFYGMKKWIIQKKLRVFVRTFKNFVNLVIKTHVILLQYGGRAAMGCVGLIEGEVPRNTY